MIYGLSNLSDCRRQVSGWHRHCYVVLLMGILSPAFYLTFPSKCIPSINKSMQTLYDLGCQSAMNNPMAVHHKYHYFG